MNKAVSIALALAMAAATATPAFARAKHARQQAPESSPALGLAAAPSYGRYYDRRYPQTQRPASSGKIDSGYYPPRTWDEIEISGPNSY